MPVVATWEVWSLMGGQNVPVIGATGQWGERGNPPRAGGCCCGAAVTEGSLKRYDCGCTSLRGGGGGVASPC